MFNKTRCPCINLNAKFWFYITLFYRLGFLMKNQDSSHQFHRNLEFRNCKGSGGNLTSSIIFSFTTSCLLCRKGWAVDCWSEIFTGQSPTLLPTSWLNIASVLWCCSLTHQSTKGMLLAGQRHSQLCQPTTFIPLQQTQDFISVTAKHHSSTAQSREHANKPAAGLHCEHQHSATGSWSCQCCPVCQARFCTGQRRAWREDHSAATWEQTLAGTRSEDQSHAVQRDRSQESPVITHIPASNTIII